VRTYGFAGKPAHAGDAVAIYSLHHSAIGKSTQGERYTAGAHVNYITRARALTRIDGERMPVGEAEAAAFLKAGEDSDRANARVIDKVMLALPRELNPAQRAALVRAFAEDVTKGRASWLAAFHEGGKDAENPHVHLVIRDRDAETGKRVAKLSEKGSTERLRLLWEQHANMALQLAQRPERIDRRTLEAQGIRRKPTIHEGVRARRLRKKRRRLQSRPRDVRNAALARSRTRRVDYPGIDRGQSRGAYNAALKAQPEIEAELWAAYDDQRQRDEIEALRTIHRPPGEAEEPFNEVVWLEDRRRKLRRKKKIE
jgi:hypothetical protein